MNTLQQQAFVHYIRTFTISRLLDIMNISQIVHYIRICPDIMNKSPNVHYIRISSDIMNILAFVHYIRTIRI